MEEKKTIVFITGAGMSAESGIPTFRDSVVGLWENVSIEEVCTAEAIKKDPEKVHNFYNELRRKYKDAKPNGGHYAIADLEKEYNVNIVTQNVDNLHEVAGSTNVLHLHGEMMKCRAVDNPKLIYDLDEQNPITTPDMEIDGHKVRPHIVFFNEDVPNISVAMKVVSKCDVCVVIGTSFNVYPAASLINYVPADKPIFYIDPRPAHIDMRGVDIIEKGASEGMKELKEKLKEHGI